MTQSHKETGALAIAMLAGIGIFGLDIHLPRGVAVATLYILVTSATYNKFSKKNLYLLTFFFSGAAVLGLVLKHSGVPLSIAILNRVITIIILWGASFIFAKNNKAERKVAEAENSFRKVFEAAPNALVMLDGESKISLINRQAETLFGYSRKELIGKFMDTLIPAAVYLKEIEFRSEYFNEPNKPSEAYRDISGVRKNGSKIPLEISLRSFEIGGTKKMLASIVDTTERKQAEAEKRELTEAILAAGEMERKRIGQDLHDGLGQKLLGIGFLVKALQREKTPPETIFTELERVIQLTTEAISETRQLARGLYGIELEASDLPSALSWLALNTKSTTKIEAAFAQVGITPRLEQTQVIALYRIAQEAVCNAVKHSGTHQIKIILITENRQCTLRIEDFGIGFMPLLKKRMGMGLRSMYYRAEMIGAKCEVNRKPMGGTVVQCLVPIPIHAVHS